MADGAPYPLRNDDAADLLARVVQTPDTCLRRVSSFSIYVHARTRRKVSDTRR